MSERPVRVRIGPSPTGEPHVGTGYIALYNLAFAKKHGGRFVLRIEDTDQERSDPEWERQIMDALKWLGLGWDEGPDVGGPHGPYRQSERTEIYRGFVDELLEQGHAYRCFATKEELDALRKEQMAKKETPRYDGRHRNLDPDTVKRWMDEGRPHVIRMKMPTEGKVVVRDRLRGAVEFDASQSDDQVILKSDGFPTYHLANVVDDHLMQISHVIRAEEWISSTPKHVVLYQMLGWPAPEFVHMPLLLNMDGSKISKRKSPVSILDYQQRGFFPEALVNFLGLLGFTLPDEREVFTLDEFADALDLDRIQLGGKKFDLDKLTWLNGKYLREKKSDLDLVRALREGLFSQEYLSKVAPLIKERIDVAEQFIDATSYFFNGDVELDVALMRPKKRSLSELKEILELYVAAVERQVDFSPQALEDLSRSFAEAHEWKTRDLFMPLRVAVTGRKASPPLFDVMSVLGRSLVRRRLRNAVEAVKQAATEEMRAQQKAEKEAKKAEKKAKKGSTPEPGQAVEEGS